MRNSTNSKKRKNYLPHLGFLTILIGYAYLCYLAGGIVISRGGLSMGIAGACYGLYVTRKKKREEAERLAREKADFEAQDNSDT